MSKLHILIIGLFLLICSAVLANCVKALSPSSGAGVYTNLCGTGTAATADTCNQGCNTGSGSCSGTAVAKFVCNGRQNECGGNGATPIGPEEWSSSQNIGGVGCGQTVQLDVYTEKCRLDDGSWKAGCQPIDYIVWYSDCTAPPPQQQTCSYSSTQARVQRNLSDPWDTSKTINLGDQIRVGGFHDGTGLLASDSDVSLSVSSIGSVGNGSFITPSQSGTYTLTVTTPGQSGPHCQDSATFQVQAAQSCTSNGSCSAPTPACGTITSGVDNCGNPCTRQGSACPAQGGNISITNNPTNTITNNPTNTITFGNVGTGTSQPVVVQPQVAGVAVSTLPKTGLPALAWSALGLVPIGFRMRRFNKVEKELENDPRFIWEERQFKAGS